MNSITSKNENWIVLINQTIHDMHYVEFPTRLKKNHCPRDGSLGLPCRTSSGFMFSRERTGREKREDRVDLIFLICFFLGGER